jgi:integrase
MLLLTGARRSEVSERKLWSIPIARVKSKAAHVVPLTDDVLATLERLPRFARGDHLFSTTMGVKAVNGFSKIKARFDKAVSKELGREIEPYVIHDIRRTVRTRLSTLPIPDLVRELVIGHTQQGLHKIYDQHAYLDEKRHALELWAKRLRDIIEPPPVNVTDLGAHRARAQ